MNQDININNGTIVSPVDTMKLVFAGAKEDSVIAIGSRRLGKEGDKPFPHYLCPVYFKHLEQWFTPIMEWTLHQEQTAYFVHNTLSRKALVQGDAAKYTTSLLEKNKPVYFEVKKEHVREFAAIVLDLDFYKAFPEMTPYDAVSLVYRGAVVDKFYPPPSIGAFSGRGAYCFWFLTDGAGALPLNNEENLHLRELAFIRLCQLTEDLDPDKALKNIAQWVKAPGTKDHKTGNTVYFFTLGVNAPGNTPRYTLPWLMKALNIPTVITRPPVKVMKALPGPLPEGGYTYRPPHEPDTLKPVKPNVGAQYKARFMDIEKLAQSRGGIPEGQRWKFLYPYFCAARAYHTIRRDPDAFRKAKDAALKLNMALCKPPMVQKELLASLSKRRRKKGDITGANYTRFARSSRITHDLGITEDEAKTLKLRALIPPEMKAQHKDLKAQAAKDREWRRLAVDCYIDIGFSTDVIIHMLIITAYYTAGQEKTARRFIERRRKFWAAKFPDPQGEMFKNPGEPET